MGIWVALLTLAIGTSSVCAVRKEQAPQIPLTGAGQELFDRYSSILTELKAEICEALPAVDARKKEALMKARATEIQAEEALATARQNLAKIKKAKGLVAHAKGKWIGGADKGIAAAKEQLKHATTDAERQTAENELAKWKRDREDGVEALKQRQAAWEKAERERPRVEQELKAAEKRLVEAKSRGMATVKSLGLISLLSDDKLDAKLAKYSILLEATPRGLAAFAQQGRAQYKLVDQMLADDNLLIQMAVADGARDGNYGQAMKIYNDIQRATTKAGKGPLQRLALAVALEHAVPVAQRSAEAQVDAPATVDPLKRYLHFEKAYLDGELDPAFSGLTVWDYRMVVNGEEPEEILSWGRQMLRNYRPDHITTADYRWRYVGVVRTDIQYGSQDNKYDKDELQFFQNILMNGGVCGRRAFFGRFILRAFGIPTTARPSRGHAALAHWTPEGWVVCLGGGWGAGWTKTPYKKDLDFLATTQARATGRTYLQVKRAHWIGDATGEKRSYGLFPDNIEFWNGVALYTQRSIIEDAKSKTLAAVGVDIAEANETREKIDIAKVTITDTDRAIRVDSTGVITIPAAAISEPTKSTGRIIFMNSNLGGRQLHYSRNGKPQDFEYSFDAPRAGTYALTARVVTPSWKQHLQVSVNGTGNPVEIALPFTVGMWGETEPLKVVLVKGRNVLSFARNEPVKGVTIRNFTLTPIE